MRVVRRLMLVLGAFVAAILYVWVTAVRAVPGVKRRKQEARLAQRR